MLGPFATTSRLTPIHQMSLAVLSRAACASMSTTTTTTRQRVTEGTAWPHGMGPITIRMQNVTEFIYTCTIVSFLKRLPNVRRENTVHDRASLQRITIESNDSRRRR